MFEIVKQTGHLARAGLLHTPHGVIETPAFVPVATKATVKGLLPETVRQQGTQVLIANTYHLYFSPGAEIVAKAGGLHRFMNWSGPLMTDSGGFQVFSLGAGYEAGVSKISFAPEEKISEFLFVSEPASRRVKRQKLADFSALVKIDEEGVTFRSPLDGSEHRLDAEKSMAIQHQLGADIIFAFDECAAPTASREYQIEAMERTHRWTRRSLAAHQRLSSPRTVLKTDAQGQSLVPSLFGIIQGGRHQDLRKTSAEVIGALDFDGFGIGGSFDKEDIEASVMSATAVLPSNKPRHLLGIGGLEDIVAGVEAGIDTFDCVLPTRLGRTGTLLTKDGRVNILNRQYREDFSPVESDCQCQTCAHYTRAYLSHLFHAREMLGPTLASIHNIFFMNNFLKNIRQRILNGKKI